MALYGFGEYHDRFILLFFFLMLSACSNYANIDGQKRSNAVSRSKIKT